jgi:hypothetical protein
MSFFRLPSGNQTWLAGKSHEIPQKNGGFTAMGRSPMKWSFITFYNWENHRTKWTKCFFGGLIILGFFF